MLYKLESKSKSFGADLTHDAILMLAIQSSGGELEPHSSMIVRVNSEQVDKLENDFKSIIYSQQKGQKMNEREAKKDGDGS